MYTKKICFLLLLLGLLWVQRAGAQCNGTPPVVEIAPPATLTCQNPTVQLQATITPPNGDYILDWSGPVSDPTILNPTISEPGVYALFVLDSATGCWGGDTIVVEQDGSIPVATISMSVTTCDPSVDPVVLSAGIPGPFDYAWSSGETTPSIEVMQAGVTTYCVTITNNQSGCSATSCISVVVPEPLELEINYFNSPYCDDSTGMWVGVTGGSAPYVYIWNNGLTHPFLWDPPAGDYTVTVVDANGCSQTASYVIEENGDECAHLQGYVYADWDVNCTAGPADEGLNHIILHLEDAIGNEFYTETDATGFYHIQLLAGTYDVTVVPPNGLWDPCQATYSISINPNQTIDQDFFLQPEAVCPAMTVDLGAPFLRRCFNGQYWVKYCNQGTEDASGAYAEILFDSFLSVTEAQIPYTDLGNNLYRFDLGDVPFNTCGNFWVKVHVSCDATLGQTHCTEAVIYPTGTCAPVDPQWSGASLQVNVDCGPDSLDFAIENAGSGSMAEALEYVIIEDAVMLMQAPPPSVFLAPGEVYHVKVPANGSTWRVEVAQEAFHPGNSMPSAALEGCSNNTPFSTGFINQFPADDNDPWVDIDCTENVGSYDPNDKQGFPVGYAAAHFIEPGTEIEYMIRFQNTGTDTAFTVVVRDQLSSWLDPASVRPGASSHPYTFAYYGDRDIKFTFENILLPDSSDNQEASQGFVTFRVAQMPDVPLQTDIFNQASIYFDFNEAVVTNTTVHRVGRDFVTVSAWQPFRDGLELQVMPNPVARQAILQLNGLESLNSWQVELRDATGRKVRAEMVQGSQWLFERGTLASGLYLIQVRTNEGQLLGSGKMLLK